MKFFSLKNLLIWFDEPLMNCLICPVCPYIRDNSTARSNLILAKLHCSSRAYAETVLEILSALLKADRHR